MNFQYFQLINWASLGPKGMYVVCRNLINYFGLKLLVVVKIFKVSIDQILCIKPWMNRLFNVNFDAKGK